MTWVKICGTTNLEDAMLAYHAGADAVGFVFAESKRHVTPEGAWEICKQLPEDMERVGVFNHHTVPMIKSAVKQAGLTRVQLHGHDDWQIATKVAEETGVKVACVLHIMDNRLPGPLLKHHLAAFSGGVDTVLIDTAVHGRTGGGTGVTWDWNAFAPMIETLGSVAKVVVAGGLTPGNVGVAISTLHPWGVDVVTGVEREAGKKDPDKVRAFIAAVRQADEDALLGAGKENTCQ
jgi:phosphoribosylanthranilate isomerase